MVRKRSLAAAITMTFVVSAVGFAAGDWGLGARNAEAQPTHPAQGPLPDGTSRDTVVARVGSQTITIGDLERRIRAVPPFALRRYGSTPAEIKHRFLDEVLVRELILNQGALDLGLDKRPDVYDRSRAILRGALLDQFRQQIGSQPISDDEVKKYFNENTEKYVSPRRLSIWRILVGSEPEARDIIAQVKSGEDIKLWNQLARDKSLDKASSMRSGNLGFVNPDGTTAQPDLKLDVALFDAADKVKDGEIVADPVKEGDKWAVVWRRQAMRAVSRSVESEGPSIRSTLGDQKMRSAVEELLATLRSANVTEMHPELCDMVAVTETGDVEKAKRPGILPKPKLPGQPTPVESPAGLR